MLEVPAGAQAGPDFDVEAATRAYIDLISAGRAREIRCLQRGRLLATTLGLPVRARRGVAAARHAAVGQDARSERPASPAGCRCRPRFTQCCTLSLTTLLVFPLTLYQDFFREHQYGFATQTLGPWLGDQGMGLLVNVILAAVAMMLVYAAIRRMPRRWWIGGAVAAMFFLRRRQYHRAGLYRAVVQRLPDAGCRPDP